MKLKNWKNYLIENLFSIEPFLNNKFYIIYIIYEKEIYDYINFRL